MPAISLGTYRNGINIPIASNVVEYNQKPTSAISSIIRKRHKPNHLAPSRKLSPLLLPDMLRFCHSPRCERVIIKQGKAIEALVSNEGIESRFNRGTDIS
jgi:hypothetical protein